MLAPSKRNRMVSVVQASECSTSQEWFQRLTYCGSTVPFEQADVRMPEDVLLTTHDGSTHGPMQVLIEYGLSSECLNHRESSVENLRDVLGVCNPVEPSVELV